MPEEVGRMTVELYEGTPGEFHATKRSQDVSVLSVVISHGDDMITISMDEERGKWEIEVVGQSTIYHQ